MSKEMPKKIKTRMLQAHGFLVSLSKLNFESLTRDVSLQL
jgi:hypothetical protein